MMPILARFSFSVWPGRLGDHPNAGWNLMHHLNFEDGEFLALHLRQDPAGV